MDQGLTIQDFLFEAIKMGERTYIEIRIFQVYKPGKTGHDPSRKSLALYRIEDLSKLQEIIELLNSISPNKIDYEEIMRENPLYRRMFERL